MTEVKIPKSVVWAVALVIICGICYHFNYRLGESSTAIKKNQETIEASLSELTKLRTEFNGHVLYTGGGNG